MTKNPYRTAPLPRRSWTLPRWAFELLALASLPTAAMAIVGLEVACGGRVAAGPCGELGNACCTTTAWSASGEPGRVCAAGLQCMDLDQNDHGAGAACLYHCGDVGEVCCNSDPSVGWTCAEGLTCEDVPSADALEPYPGQFVANRCAAP